jgi:hypothetical protein
MSESRAKWIMVCVQIMKEMGDRRQETGDRRQETGSRKNGNINTFNNTVTYFVILLLSRSCSKIV